MSKATISVAQRFREHVVQSPNLINNTLNEFGALYF